MPDSSLFISLYWMQTYFKKEDVCLKDCGGLVVWYRDPMWMFRYDNMTNDTWANKNERNDLKTENGKNLRSCVDNSRMSEVNDENEIVFICKHFGNVKIGGVGGGVEDGDGGITK